MATTTPPAATEQDLLRMPKDGRKYELVDGQIRVSPGGARHSRVCVRLVVRLSAFADARGLGLVFESSMGFRLPGGNIRSPDASFVARTRLDDERPGSEFLDLAPDLAVEVVSPGDRTREILDKVGEYLEAGVSLVWVLDPRRRTAAVHRSLTEVRQLGPDDVLDGEDVLPGFTCRVADLVD